MSADKIKCTTEKSRSLTFKQTADSVQCKRKKNIKFVLPTGIVGSH